MIKLKNQLLDMPGGWLFISLLTIFVLLFFFNHQNNGYALSQQKNQYYTVADFQYVPKIDGHFHYNTSDVRYLKYADSLNFRIISPNVDTEISIDQQLEITSRIKKQFPEKFAFFGTFSVDRFGTPGFARETVDRIAKCMEAGAAGIKIWKNIGMSLQDHPGKFVMVDDARFDSVFNYLEQHHIPLLAHLGEPKNCWLPVDEMTTANDKRYYQNHPQYHMFLHPEAPSYQDQINVRNHLLQKHPKLDYVGAHLASEEWSVEELAKSFDTYPQLKADLAARISHLMYQSSTDRDKVRSFLIKYQDRIIYGTDQSVNEKDTNYSSECEGMKRTWLNNWIYFATDSSMVFREMPNIKLKGLQLPREVIDKIFHKNAEIYFNVVVR